MGRLRWAFLVVGVVAILTPVEGLAKKKKDAPPPIEFSVLRKGKVAGTFSYKVATFSGKYFSSSQLELSTKKGTLAIMTHVEKDGAGKLLKYRKWVGNEGARPDVIAFWKGPKLRVVSKLKGKRFTRDLDPPKGFEVLDQLGFHLYGDLAEMWASAQKTEFKAVTIHKGRLDEVALAPAGTAILKDDSGNEVRAEAVHLKAKGFNLTFFVGDKPRYLGFQSKSMVVIRKGWNLVKVEAEAAPALPVEEKPVEEKPAEEKPAEEKPAEEKPVEEKSVEEKPVEEKPVEEKPVEEKPDDGASKEPAKDLPPLPE